MRADAADLFTSARILLAVAHPDDETVGAGALLMRSRSIRVIHVTQGSPENLSDARAAGFSTQREYALARMKEARRALAIAGIPADAIRNLGYTDQQVSFHMAELALELREIVEREAPEIILTHAYEGGHPDHDAVAFACQAALGENDWRRARPQLIEFPAYNFAGGAGRIQEFPALSQSPEIHRTLSAEEKTCKRQMLGAFATQQKTLETFLPLRPEVYREAPAYDFSESPHPGKLFYENFDWGVDGNSWRRLARQALEQVRCCRRVS